MTSSGVPIHSAALFIKLSIATQNLSKAVNAVCKGIALPYAQSAADLFGDDDAAKVVHSSNNACCFHKLSPLNLANYDASICK